jgi:hypothetical protein
VLLSSDYTSERFKYWGIEIASTEEIFIMDTIKYSKKPVVYAVVLSAAIGVGSFIAGRMSMKNEILNTLEQRVTTPQQPVPLPKLEWSVDGVKKVVGSAGQATRQTMCEGYTIEQLNYLKKEIVNKPVINYK